MAHWLSCSEGMWDLPGPGLEPVSPALAGVFLTTGKSHWLRYLRKNVGSHFGGMCACVQVGRRGVCHDSVKTCPPGAALTG